MLLNSVVVTVNQLLPVTVLWVLIVLCTPAQLSNKATLQATIVGVAGGLLVWWFGSAIASSFQFRGLELLQITLLLAIYGLLLFTFTAKGAHFAMLALALVAILHLHHLASFTFSYWQVSGSQSLALGVVLGIGICFSFSTLLFFFLDWFRSNKVVLVLLLLLALHAASKVAMALDLALQVDFIAANPVSLDLRGWIDEHSVMGRLLRILVGYEATPNSASLAGYVAALSLFLGISIWRQRHAK
ncbi:hypothetical protein [Pseudoalteromonas 'SMAR']|uniref:hypothetical protein n=1 Tax=Pseudoalteromonas 'SMAR' TaxID=3416908 RepID=UPI003AF23F4A